MCFGTAVEEKLKEQEVQQDQQFQESDAVEGEETPPTFEEAMLELGLIEAALQTVTLTSVIGKEGVHAVARAILMLPLEGKTTPEQKEAFKQFIRNEAKRLMAGVLAAEKEQGEVSGN